MNKTTKRAVITALAAVILSGCASDESLVEEVASAKAAQVASNGLHLNGLHLNGLHLNGLHLNGLHLNGLHLNGLHLNGITLDATQFRGKIGGMITLAGHDFVGVTIQGTLSDGSSVDLQIDDIEASSDPEIMRYKVSYRQASGEKSPLCVNLDGTPAFALPLRGLWDASEGTRSGGSHIDDPSVFTFACEGYALAKCVEMGYKPWKSVVECDTQQSCKTLSLAAFHQACTRMLRADYCGNGTPMTRDGTLIDVLDNTGIQIDERPNWNLEAEWGPLGANCVETTRWRVVEDTSPEADDEDPRFLRVKKYIKATCPDRWIGRRRSPCGSRESTLYTENGFETPLDERTLMMSRQLTRRNQKR